MNKTLLILATVAVLLAAVVLADRATRKTVLRTSASDMSGTIAMAPDFQLKDLQGHDVSLSQYRGKVVLVDFWATWCDPCRVEIPWLIELQEKYGPRGFTVLGVAMDDEGKSVVEPYVQKERFTVNGQPQAMNYPILLGNDDIGEKSYSVFGYPTSVLVARDGKQVKRFEGLTSFEEFEHAIQSALQAN